MHLGYNTNGLTCHDPLEAIGMLADIGYQGIAITIDHAWLNPAAADFEQQLIRIKRELQLHRLKSVVETGARYLLDPRHKHEPTLISDGAERRQRRIEFLRQSIDIARSLESDCVSLWSGYQPSSIDLQTAMDRLADSLQPVIKHAQEKGVVLGFEPEPGMIIDTMAAYDRLLNWVDAPHFKLTLDIGHLFCQGELPIVDFIHRYADRIVNVHLEDMRAGAHEHLMFGEGQIYFPPVIKAFHEIQYTGGVYVELSRHSYDAPSVAQRSLDFLKPMIDHPENL